MSEPIKFYFDFSSPYGYFAALKIDELAASFGRQVEWHPMMLGAAMKVTGAKPLAEIELKGDYCKNDWDRLARYMEVPWTLPAVFPIGTLAASRAFYWLQPTIRTMPSPSGLPWLLLTSISAKAETSHLPKPSLNLPNPWVLIGTPCWPPSRIRRLNNG